MKDFPFFLFFYSLMSFSCAATINTISTVALVGDVSMLILTGGEVEM